MTFHPSGGRGSAEWFHDEDWLDFNMRQNGHVTEFSSYAATRSDYDRTPTKPVLDGEPTYEDHRMNLKGTLLGYATAADVRRPFYWNVFSGAFGHTYGHHSVWQMHSRRHVGIKGPLIEWREALDRPGAQQMIFGRRLIESRPFLTRIPDDDILVPSDFSEAVPGTGLYRFVATRDAGGRFAMIYAPVGRAFRVRLDKIAGSRVRAWWFNPRNGEATSAGEFANRGEREFVPPTPGEVLDWVLVLDDAAENFPPPGKPSA